MAPVTWRAEYLKHRFWSLVLLTIVIIFMAGVGVLVFKNYKSTAPEFMVERERQRRAGDRVSTHRLSFFNRLGHRL